MQIGINLLYLIPGAVGGTETYARELIPELAKLLTESDSIILYCSRETAPTWGKLPGVQVRTLPFYAKNRLARLIFEQTILPIYAWQDKVDVLFSLGYSAPFIHHCPSVVTIHDLNWYYHPEDFGKLNRFMWEWITRFSASTSNHIITDSQASAKSICEILHQPKSKITSILHGTPQIINSKPYKNLNPYILTVVAGYPHKNLKTLLKAFAKFHQNNPKIDLVICGLGGKADTSNLSLIDKLSINSSVNILGYVKREELAALYKGALFFVFPSAYEGFGYPVLEAMSYGAPVISSNAYSLTEVVGEAGIQVDPGDVQGFVTAMTNLIQSKNMRTALQKKGYARASKLQWENTATKTFSIIKGLYE